jgi:hypothetical protein
MAFRFVTVNLSNMRFLAGFAAAAWAFSWGRLLYFQTGFPGAVGVGTACAVFAGFLAAGLLVRLGGRLLPLTMAWLVASVLALIPWTVCAGAEGTFAGAFRAAGASPWAALGWAFLAALPAAAGLGLLLRRVFLESVPLRSEAFLRGMLVFAALAALTGWSAVTWLWLASAMGLAAVVVFGAAGPLAPGRGEEEPPPALSRAESWIAAFLIGFYAVTLHRLVAVPMEGAGVAALAVLGALALWGIVGGRLGEAASAFSFLGFGALAALAALLTQAFLSGMGPVMRLAGGGTGLWLYAALLAAPTAFLWTGIRRANLPAAGWSAALGLGALAGYAMTAWTPHFIHLSAAATAGLALGIAFNARPTQLGLARSVFVTLASALLVWQVYAVTSAALWRLIRSPLAVMATPDIHVHLNRVHWRGEYPSAEGGDGILEGRVFFGSRYEAQSIIEQRGKFLAGMLAAMQRPGARAVLVTADDAFIELRGLFIGVSPQRLDMPFKSSDFSAYARERAREIVESGLVRRHVHEAAQWSEAMLPQTAAAKASFRAAGGRHAALPVAGSIRYDLVFHRAAGPWGESETAHTTEAVAFLKKCLTPGAMVVVPLDTLYLDLRMAARVVKAYAGQFRHLQLWGFDPRRLFLLASDESLALHAPFLYAPFQPGSPYEQVLQAFEIPNPQTFVMGFMGGNELLDVVPSFRAADALRDGTSHMAALLPRDWREAKGYPMGPDMLLPYGPAWLPIREFGIRARGELAFPEPITVVLRPEEGWQLTFAGFEFRPAMDASDYVPLFTAEMGASGSPRSIRVWQEPNYVEPVPLETLAANAAPGEILSKGQGAIAEHPLRWVTSRREDGAAWFTWAWYCRDTDQFFMGRLSDSEPPKDSETGELDWDAMRRFAVGHVSCFHRGKPSLLIAEPARPPARP